jgi:hypothetical protein
MMESCKVGVVVTTAMDRGLNAPPWAKSQHFFLDFFWIFFSGGPKCPTPAQFNGRHNIYVAKRQS